MIADLGHASGGTRASGALGELEQVWALSDAARRAALPARPAQGLLPHLPRRAGKPHII